MVIMTQDPILDRVTTEGVARSMSDVTTPTPPPGQGATQPGESGVEFCFFHLFTKEPDRPPASLGKARNVTKL